MKEYPTEEELEIIKKWPFEKGWKPLMDFIQSVWWMPDWGWRNRGSKYWISTGGWSGNEEIIQAMHENYIFWALCWEQHRRGGHYIFKLPRKVKENGKEIQGRRHGRVRMAEETQKQKADPVDGG